MAIDKLIPQYLNSDTDQKLVKSVEMTDNINVRVSNDSEGTAGVLKNVKGTDSLSPKTPADALPAGENRVIGSVDNEKNNEILFFLWNENDDHGIFRIDTITDSFELVYSDSVLGFSKYAHVDCDIIVNEDEHTLLYWTDNINPPMKINVNRAISGDYPASLTSGTDEEKLLNLTVAKQPPLKSPSYSLVNNSSLTYNNVNEKLFQFAYKYVYEDGEHSALSPYSTVAFAQNMMKDYFISEGKKKFFNQIDIYIQNTPAEVKEIIVYAKEANMQTFYQIDKIANSYGTGVTTVSFTNNKLGRPLSQEEVAKTYDNVPQRAKALAVTNNRLFFGNYEEGYANIDVDTELVTNYIQKPVSYDISVEISTPDPTIAIDAAIPRIKLDLTNVPSVVPDNSMLSVNFVLNFGNINIGGAQLGDETISINDGELEVVYERRDDSRTVEVNTISVRELAGESFFEQLFQAFLDSKFPNLFPSGFNPALAFDAEGLYVRENIPIDANTSKADIIDIISARLEGKTFDTFLNPVKGARRLTVTRHTPSNWVAEKGSFQGTSTFKFEEVTSLTTANAVEFNVVLQHIDINLYEFLKDGAKPTNIVSTDRLRLPAFEAGTRRITPYFFEQEIIEGTSGLYEDLDGKRSFKSGASHKMGIVYLDDRGRASGVQEAGNAFVTELNKRTAETNGASSIVMKVNHTAPSWASKWLPVYVGSGSTELKFMYSVLGAFVPRNNTNGISALQNKKQIYVSVNSIFGDKGFNKSLGADVEYKFEKGDRLRVIDYGRGNKYTSEFKVVGYEVLKDDEDNNPILDKINEQAISVTTGEFLVLEDNGSFPFSYSAIVNENSKWFDNCIVEVYRPKKELDDEAYVYYELGKVYDVENGEHSSERNGTTLGATIDYVNGVLLLYSADKFFKGDILEVGGSTITVNDVWYEDGFYYATYLDKNIPLLGVGSYLFNITNYAPAIEITQGDVYFRPRLLFTASKQISQVTYRSADSMPAIVDWIEDYSVSDFFPSKRTSIGKAYAYIPEAETTRRISSITYSDAFVIDSDRLNLSSFNLSLANWKDLDIEHGQIDKIVPRADALTVLQNSKVSNVPVGRNLVAYADGKQSLTTSTDVLGKEAYYSGDFGSSGNPEAVVERFGVVYFTDLNSRRVIRVSADGITPISEKGLDSYIQRLFEDVSKNATVKKIVGGFDPDNNEYIMTVEDFSQSTISVGSSDPQLEPTVYEVEVNDDGLYVVEPAFTSSDIIWNTLDINWNNLCLEWEKVGDGILFIDSDTLYIDSNLIGSTGDLDIIITDTNYNFVAIGQYSFGNDLITIPTQTCDGRGIVTKFGGAESQGVTLAYDHKSGYWNSKYSFQPSNYANIGNAFYSFFQNDNGLVWKHNVNETRGLFYGVQYPSSFEVVSNHNPSMIKVFQAIGIEGGGTWTAQINTSTQETDIQEFTEREGHSYAMIPMDTVNSKSHQIYLGTVESVTGNNVTFTTQVNRVPFNIGDTIKVASGSNLITTSATITSMIDRNTLALSGGNFNVGDKLFVEHLSIIDGDPMRDVYATIKMTSTDSEPFEVHAISVHYDRSRLHNDRVN